MLKTIGYYIWCAVLLLGCSQSNTSIAKKKEKRANDLINETSPYLLQHAYNPVDWKAWNDESLNLAKEQNKLIVISVGYSACHWCHVMEEESFENDSVAKLMNDNFINIKVDREERPDVDQIYMNAVQLMTGSGGWPLNCITLPDGRPVFGGTYFTKSQWTKILKDMSSLYESDPNKVIAYAKKLTEGIKNADLIKVNNEEVLFTKAQIETVINKLKPSLDFKKGGLKNAPKFPMPSHLKFLLRYSFQYNDEDIKKFVLNTLNKMSNGGIYDQIGGGFSRYSVDERWHVPHFEKMLYDNAQLVSLYSKAYQLTKNESFKIVVAETLSFIEKELTQNEGAFYSSIDADSKTTDGLLEEGVFYTWTKDELKTTLSNDFDLFKSYYNINATGKWEKDKYILYKTETDQEFIKTNNITLEELQSKLSLWKTKLYKLRNKRERPRTDDKVLTSWNALMLKAYVDAYRVFGEQSYIDKAIANATFIKDNQIKTDGALFHNYKDGKSTIEGFSEDYAYTIAAYIELYQATFNEEWLNISKALIDYAITHFLNDETRMFYFTSDEATNLITRKTEILDNVIPSSNSVLALCLFKLGHYYSNKTYTDLAKQMLSNVNEDIKEIPSGYTNWLELYLNYSNPYYEVAISGLEAHSKLKEFDKSYIPNVLISGSDKNTHLPLLKNKFIEDETYIYVCVNGTCKLPVTTTKEAIEQILK
ncbi:thioredoxin domain-containing protein [uncultured Winogradskyella sp.]|uniref:thioredoxin domain-containing protein n=1 Tax=uncultured Winogradskyella sp. TaxID=395353 RepID=UPI002607F874|nr:thioredoxin domain-containing protein [uncultured Winogradskyella sp.]